MSSIGGKMPATDDFTKLKDSDDNSDSDVSLIWLIAIYGPAVIGLIVFICNFF